LLGSWISHERRFRPMYELLTIRADHLNG